MPVAALLIAIAALGGYVLSYAYDDDAPPVARLAYGVTTGAVLLGVAGFAGAAALGIAGGLAVGSLVAASPLLWLVRPGVRRRVRSDWRHELASLGAAIRRPSRGATLPLVYAVAAFAFLWLVFDRVILESNGGLATGYVNNLGDLPFHFQVVSSFAYGQNFPAEDPSYAGTSFAYPFLSDFVTALLVQLGASFRDAFFVQNMALGMALVVILHRFTVVLTRDRLAAFIAPLLVLFSGGVGFVTLLADARRGEQGLLAVLTGLTHDTTIVGEGPYRWGNAITTLLVTQRSLAFGLPLSLLVFVLLWKVIAAPPPRHGAWAAWRSRPLPAVLAVLRESRVALAAGILTGCLPLVHAHSYVVVTGTAFVLGLLFRQWREGRWVTWAVYVLAALAVGLPEVWMTTASSVANAGSFLGIELGWDHGQVNVVWFWLLNTGLFIPLAVAAVAWFDRDTTRRRSLVLFSLAFVTWFVVGNVIRLAPWIWDNIKVLFYSFVGFVPIVSLLLATMFRAGRTWRSGAVVALLVLTLSGAIDVWRVISRQTEYGEFDRDGVALANAIRAETDPRSLILHAPTWNPPVFLTGRRSLLGYTGYVWAHGLAYADREAEIKRIYAGEPDAGQLLARYGVDYIVVSPLERQSMSVNEAFIGGMRLVAQSGDYRLYEVAQP